jgi:hypothetical protein
MRQLCRVLTSIDIAYASEHSSVIPSSHRASHPTATGPCTISAKLDPESIARPVRRRPSLSHLPPPEEGMPGNIPPTHARAAHGLHLHRLGKAFQQRSRSSSCSGLPICGPVASTSTFGMPARVSWAARIRKIFKCEAPCFFPLWKLSFYMLLPCPDPQQSHDLSSQYSAIPVLPASL